MNNLIKFKKEFDPILEDFLNGKIKETKTIIQDPFIESLVAHAKNLTISGGKRVRPYSAYLMYKTLGSKEDKKILKFLTALEIFHTFCLIHDDVMDNSTKRHGVKTINNFALEKLKQDKRSGDLAHTANSQAILVGDLFYSWALEILNNIDFLEKEKINNVKKHFFKMAEEVVFGQIIDIDISSRKTVSDKLIDKKITLKTASYTFTRPFMIGASLTGMTKQIEDFCQKLGTSIGVAFQIQDDLLDITGNSKNIKKDLFKDISENQHTFFTNYIFKHGTLKQKQKLSKFFGKKIDKKDYEEIRNLFIESGAISAGKKIIENNFKLADKNVEKFNIKNENKKDLSELIEIVKNREN